ncbi:hypothetical protein H8356DRAFT_1085025 [Neocallimastix lanati (nom. inval.)]|nr:hypothetical protein H8356DRAFT_1085025 [Neocallimastix sp. JGI-2020a]
MKITFSWMMMIIPEAEINYVTTGTTRQNHKKNFFLLKRKPTTYTKKNYETQNINNINNNNNNNNNIDLKNKSDKNNENQPEDNINNEEPAQINSKINDTNIKYQYSTFSLDATLENDNFSENLKKQGKHIEKSPTEIVSKVKYKENNVIAELSKNKSNENALNKSE